MRRGFTHGVLAVALAGCVPAVVTPPALAPATFSCEAARDTDFEGAGEQALRGYVAWLAREHGATVKLLPSQVSLGIVRGPAKPGPMGVQAAEIGCGSDGYRITLYRNALSGRPLALSYHTLAHEFHHVVQIRRDRLDCQARGQRADYEREADDFAARLVPACGR